MEFKVCRLKEYTQTPTTSIIIELTATLPISLLKKVFRGHVDLRKECCPSFEEEILNKSPARLEKDVNG